MEEKIKILHVDDDDDIRLITKLALSLNAKFVVEQSSSGFEALEMVKSFVPDVFLLDMMMPGMTGEETWNTLKKDRNLVGVPAIFMSAKAERSFANRLIGKGALAVITKPFDPMTLCEQIEEYLGEHDAILMQAD